VIYSSQELHHKSITENFVSQFPDIIKYIKSLEQRIDESKVQLRKDLLEKNLLMKDNDLFEKYAGIEKQFFVVIYE
jgi:hypothetical protein